MDTNCRDGARNIGGTSRAVIEKRDPMLRVTAEIDMLIAAGKEWHSGLEMKNINRAVYAALQRLGSYPYEKLAQPYSTICFENSK